MPKYFDKCILHIGTEKTGTTTLQKFLGVNRSALADRGYFVPTSLSPYQVLANHERLTTLSLETGKLNDDLRRAAGLASVEDVIAHKINVRDDLDAEIRRCNCVPPNLLLTNEHCHSRLTSDNEVRTLRNFLFEFVNDVQVIVYLRPQHELATSLYDQALKAGYADIEVLPHLEGNKSRWIERKYFDYDDLTSRWSRVFGIDKLKPRIFTRDELAGGSIIDDFLRAIGCDGGGMIVPRDENKSISAALQPVMNAVNRYGRTHPESVTAQIRARLIATLQQLSEGGGRLPSRSEATEFYNMFLESNERVRKHYFPQRASLFSVDFTKFPDQPPAVSSEADALVEALLATMGKDNPVQLPKAPCVAL